MRGGPINTRKIPLPEDSARELQVQTYYIFHFSSKFECLQEVVERNKEELLEHIPEGGHVTVLVFRDGNKYNRNQT